MCGEGCAAIHCLFDGLQQKSGRLLEKMNKKRFLVGKVKVKGTDSDVCLVDDVADRRRMIALVGKYAHSGLHHRGAFGVLLEAGLFCASIWHDNPGNHTEI